MSKPLNKRQLAVALGDHAPGYVSAMIRAGYRMRYGGTRTSLCHALAWLEANPNFRASHQYPKKKKEDDQNPPRPQRPKGHPAEDADKRGEPALTNG